MIGISEDKEIQGVASEAYLDGMSDIPPILPSFAETTKVLAQIFQNETPKRPHYNVKFLIWTAPDAETASRGPQHEVFTGLLKPARFREAVTRYERAGHLDANFAELLRIDSRSLGSGWLIGVPCAGKPARPLQGLVVTADLRHTGSPRICVTMGGEVLPLTLLPPPAKERKARAPIATLYYDPHGFYAQDKAAGRVAALKRHDTEREAEEREWLDVVRQMAADMATERTRREAMEARIEGLTRLVMERIAQPAAPPPALPSPASRPPVRDIEERLAATREAAALEAFLRHADRGGW